MTLEGENGGRLVLLPVGGLVSNLWTATVYHGEQHTTLCVAVPYAEAVEICAAAGWPRDRLEPYV